MISKLPPAHYLVYRNGRAEVSEYWDLKFEEDDSIPEAEWTERVREQLARSVRAQMLADVPLGAFLSGGIDSSTIVALMSSFSELKPTTYTLGFRREDLRYDILEDDVRYARMVGTGLPYSCSRRPATSGACDTPRPRMKRPPLSSPSVSRAAFAVMGSRA